MNFLVDKSFLIWYINICAQEDNKKAHICTSGSVVEHRVANARVASSNLVSCFIISPGILDSKVSGDFFVYLFKLLLAYKNILFTKTPC